jgi:thiamine-phosphate pyrophosphorylase
MSGRPVCDLSLYLVVGPGDAPRHRLVDLVVDAVAGGVTMVQLRRKDSAGREFVEQARALVRVLRPLHVPLIVNDRIDVALAAGADGVHVGQGDMLPADAGRLMGDGALIGLSITSLDEARAFDDGIVDYVGVGPVFATSTKPDAAAPLGIDGTRDICEAVRGVPSVAIGGISCTNAAEVLATGVHGLAVVSAICGAPRPRVAAAELAELVRAASAANAARAW